MTPMRTTAPTLYPVILPVPDADRRLKGREKVRVLSHLARIALKQSCRKSGFHLARFPKNAQGVPLPLNGIHWSLSHKSAVVGAVAAPFAVGIDLETIRPVSDGLLARVAGEDEWKLARQDRQMTFFRFWTAKEAVLKAVGKGIAGLPRCRVVEIADDTHMALTYEDIKWQVVHFLLGGHVAAVTPCHFDVSWTVSTTHRPFCDDDR
jgi:4'-phosphopantetheinyl transferase